MNGASNIENAFRFAIAAHFFTSLAIKNAITYRFCTFDNDQNARFRRCFYLDYKVASLLLLLLVCLLKQKQINDYRLIGSLPFHYYYNITGNSTVV